MNTWDIKKERKVKLGKAAAKMRAHPTWIATSAFAPANERHGVKTKRMILDYW